MTKIKKALKFIGFTLLGVFILINLYIVLSGKYYIYSGVAKTYLRGKKGPGIYDFDFFYNAKIKASNKKYKWTEHQKKNSYKLTETEEKYQEKWKTRAFLVFRSDSLLFEKYWGDHNAKTVSNSFSAAKSVISFLIGIAVEEGKIKSIDEPAGNYLPDYKTLGREKITIRDLLLMASGLNWDEGKHPLSHNAEGYYGEDLKGLISRLKSINKPGVTFNYQSGNTQILAFILEKATGKTITTYMKEKLWDPLGASADAFWALDEENGNEKAFCCMYANARDFALFGRLLMKNGRVDGKQIVPQDYMKELIKTPKLKTKEGINNLRYGLHTWVYYNNGDPVYYCRGLLGQYIMAMPSKDLIIVRLGEKREPNFVDVKEPEKVGHTEDIFQFIKLADKISNTTQ